MAEITHGVDYVTEREAFEIRGMALGGWSYNVCDMAVEFYSAKISVPVDRVKQYLEDWRKSGLWSLPGLKEEPENGNSNGSATD